MYRGTNDTSQNHYWISMECCTETLSQLLWCQMNISAQPMRKDFPCLRSSKSTSEVPLEAQTTQAPPPGQTCHSLTSKGLNPLGSPIRRESMQAYFPTAILTGEIARSLKRWSPAS
ncbi:hypothetical protein O181_085507 [Austropuccinia psidii MF-1]|uniref:Uncharacterized protein n=1 Tax=Austropuccinia psidii MF-1 TaxID=1389203 RepID=A0A9Q3FY59_9BASI|nr:hypothetical protein [Austropuccinia psidii MF-1]